MNVGNVTEKGQVTIPKHLREKYRIDDKVLFVDAGEGILVRRVPKISELKGSLKDFKIDIARMRAEDRRSVAAREKRLMAILRRSKRRQKNTLARKNSVRQPSFLKFDAPARERRS